jgi:parallel beta-helix repeat protein
LIKKCLLFLLLLFVVGSVSAVPDYTIDETDFENTTHIGTYDVFVFINESGEYNVTADFVNTSYLDHKIVIMIKDTENVVLNCNDNWINAPSTGLNHAVYIINSTNVTVKNLKSDWSSVECIHIENVNNTVIEDSEITSKNRGISIFNVEDCGIIGNKITSTEYNSDTRGIYLMGNVINSTITENNITSNFTGIYIGSSSENNVISANTINSTSQGMQLVGSKNNLISGCNIYSIDGYTLTLTDSENNLISGCNVTTPDDYGVYLGNSDNTSIINSTVNAATNTIDLNSDNCTVMGSTIRADQYSGLEVSYTGNNIIDCTIYAQYEALTLSGSDNNVSNCTLTGNHELVSLSGSDNNILRSNMWATTYNALTVGGTYQNVIDCTITAQNNTLYVNGQNIEINGSDINSNDIAVKCISASYWNRIYLNNINGSVDNQGPSNYFTSKNEVNYTYAGKNYTGILGNYWYLYDEEDAVIENGTWNIPYVININTNDSKPLAGPWDKDTNSIFGKIEYDDGKIHLTQADFATGLYIINKTGIYVLEENINSSMGIAIDSDNVTIDGNGFYMNTSGVSTFMGSYENITIKNLGLNCDNGLNLENADNVTISSCVFLVTNAGIVADGENIVISSCNFTGIDNGWGINIISMQNGTITGCKFNNLMIGINTQGESSIGNCTITYNEFIENSWGLNLNGEYNWIYLNDFESNTWANFNYDSTFTNYFHSPVLTYKYDGVVYEGRLGNYYVGEELGTSVLGIFDKPYGIVPLIPR